MRLRDISEILREQIENGPEALFHGEVPHALVQDIRSPQIVYRPVAPATRKDQVLPWLALEFMPFKGLIEPFNVYPGRFWGLLRMHRQPSGLPELLIHVERDLPTASQTIHPDLYISFSSSPRVETIIHRHGKDPATLRFFHKGNLLQPDRSVLPADFCLPGFEEALPQGDEQDGIPGIVDDPKAGHSLYLGDLVFYNNFRTADRAQLCNFLLNGLAVGTVARYVRDIVRKSMGAAQAG